MTRIAIAVFIAATSITLAAPSANEIIDKANLAAYYAGNDGRAKVKMTITDAGGKKRIREFTILRLNIKKGGDQKFYVFFKAPADVYKMAFLVWKNNGDGKEDNRWLFLPALNLVKPIAPGDKRTSFVGSDFVYEDVSGRNTKADKHELMKEEADAYLIKNTPIKPDEVEFSYYNVWIDKKTFLPKKAEYYDKNGKKYRIVEALKIETIKGHPTVLESKVSDLNTGGSTVNTFSKVEYDIGLKERVFTERFLRRPPREVK